MMGEKRVLTEEMIEEKLKNLQPQLVRYIDPMKLATWNIETAVAMTSGTVSNTTIKRVVRDGQLVAFKPGKEIGFTPLEFMTWYKRFRA